MRWKKQGNTDTVWMFLIVGIFITSAVIIPFLAAGYDVPSTTYNVNQTIDESTQEVSAIVSVNPFTVVSNLFNLIFWDIAGSLNLHWSVHLIYDILAVMFIWILARYVRGN